MLSSGEIRRQFIDFFVQRHGHEFVASSPVVPHNDPTLLFANAGMNQFKDVFLGVAAAGPDGRDVKRAVNSQKCIRAGGKHNDLEDVGRDTYHHTFFEMLGNWSFGDYFKPQIIAWAWELLIEVWDLERDRLHVTVFAGDHNLGIEADDEAAEVWREVTDIDPTHVGYSADNFWEMGETGPCGPNCEVHIDLTPDRCGAGLVDKGDPRVIELWNLVFIQFNRNTDRTLSQLPARHVDTGMGFERICQVIQGVSSNYDTDVFAPLLAGVRKVTGAADYGGSLTDPVDVAYRVIADHVRCLTFALTDGAVPGNEGRGYVLRRILRRAVRHGWQTLGTKQPFLHLLVPAVIESMGDAYPELREDPQQVMDVIKDEELSFARTLGRGIALFEQAAHADRGQIGGSDAFKLHDTYGFPLDLTQVMAVERGMSVDVAGFNRLMDEARQRARAAGGRELGAQRLIEIVQTQNPPPTQFTGYAGTELEASSFCLWFALTGDPPGTLDKVGAGDEAILVTGTTSFYGEAGGQVGDTGTIDRGADCTFRVNDTQKVGEVSFHIGLVEQGTFRTVSEPSERLRWRVDRDRRRRIMANHTGTHLLNRALRLHVNPKADQKGSLVDDQKLRFDFAHGAAVTLQQIRDVEEVVNQDIGADLPVYDGVVPLEEGKKINGLRAVFGEKYPSPVRVVSIGAPVDDLISDPANDQWAPLSIEFCGGTHLARTGDAEGVAIVREEAVGKGVRRITALSGAAAHESAATADLLLNRLAALRSLPHDRLAVAVAELSRAVDDATLPLVPHAKLRDGLAELQKTLKEHEKQEADRASGDVVQGARRIADDADGDVIVASVDGADARTLRTAMDVIRKRRPDAAMMLAAASSEKVAFVASVPKPIIDRGLKAGDWVKDAARAAGGSGGGRPDMAQAGAKDPSKLHDALEAARDYAKRVLG